MLFIGKVNTKVAAIVIYSLLNIILAIVLVKYDLSIEKTPNLYEKDINVCCAATWSSLRGGGYYIFYFKPQQDAEAAAERERNKKPPKPIIGKQKEHRHPEPEVTDYYVSPDKLGVREAPRYDAFVESLVYRGEKLHILEKKMAGVESLVTMFMKKVVKKLLSGYLWKP